jgi:two-component system chemotaxis response regulator CheY
MSTQVKIDISLLHSNFNILVLEDMIGLRLQMVKDLKSLGFKGEIHEASTVQEAIIIIQKVDIQLVLSDWNLPDGTGFEFLQKFKSILKYKFTPFIMVTTIDDISHILDAIKNGADEYVVKPWTIKELKNKIESVLAKHRSK